LQRWRFHGLFWVPAETRLMREAKTCILADWSVAGTVTAVCLRRLCQAQNSALWGLGTLMTLPL
jgi:hypothetical protein